jgi:hypothetical protein
VNAARIRFRLDFHQDVVGTDIPEIVHRFPSGYKGFLDAIARIKARRDEAKPKKGRLLGAFSASFKTGPKDTRCSGRVVYTIRAPYILIFAAHRDHDEAYRRAKARYPR